MSEYLYNLDVNSGAREQFIDITAKVRLLVEKSGVPEGVCHLFVPHTTAGITINEHADPSVAVDILAALDALVPQNGSYTHGEGNAPAHIKAVLTGNHQSVLVCGGKILLGRWQGIFFCEFDGPRQRTVMAKIVPD